MPVGFLHRDLARSFLADRDDALCRQAGQPDGEGAAGHEFAGESSIADKPHRDRRQARRRFEQGNDDARFGIPTDPAPHGNVIGQQKGEQDQSDQRTAIVVDNSRQRLACRRAVHRARRPHHGDGEPFAGRQRARRRHAQGRPLLFYNAEILPCPAPPARVSRRPEDLYAARQADRDGRGIDGKIP